MELSGDSAYETREFHREIRVKKTILLIPPSERATFWGNGASTQFSGWLPETLWVEQKVETEAWLPQTFTVRNRYVSPETVTWSITHSSELQCTSRETYAMLKDLNKLTGIGIPETQYIV